MVSNTLVAVNFFR